MPDPASRSQRKRIVLQTVGIDVLKRLEREMAIDLAAVDMRQKQHALILGLRGGSDKLNFHAMRPLVGQLIVK